MVSWNGDALLEIDDANGNLLVRVAAEVQSHLIQQLGVMNPPPYKTPSKPGEYPRKRTGALQGSVVYEPASPSAAAQAGRVKLGYSTNAFYGAVLELKRARLGLVKALEETRGTIEKLAGGP